MVSDAQGKFDKPQLNADDTLQVPSFSLPFSALASSQAKAAFYKRLLAPPPFFGLKTRNIDDIRAAMDRSLQPTIDKQYARYAVAMTERTIAGVFVQEFTPKAGIAPNNAHRVLINLHGGGFIVTARTQSQLESVPIAAVGGIKVISIDYRQAPEHTFPAASEDVASVYREVLKTHMPTDIAIYGCSAGGILAGESIAWFQKVGLPNPAAIGVFCASLMWGTGGDSEYVSGRFGGVLPPPGSDSGAEAMLNSYFKGADMKDPLVTPAASPTVLAKFPPTLFVTGTRAFEMSGATRSHILLAKAGVESQMYLWDGLDHGFFGDPDLPESAEAYDLITRFFFAQMDKAQHRVTKLK